MRPTAELSGEAWGEQAQAPTSRTIPRPTTGARTIPRSSPDRTQPMPSRLPSTRTQPPSAARTAPPTSSYRSPRTAPPPKQDDVELERMGQQIMELTDRLRASDERSAYLEQQLNHMTHMANAAAAAATAVPPTLSLPDEFSRPRAANNNWIPWTAFGLLGALMAAAYVFGYSPLRASYEEQVKQNALQASQSAQALTNLRSTFNEERQRFESQLAAAQASATAAPAAAEPAAPVARSRSSAADSDESDDDSSGHSRLTPEEREAKRAERKAAYEAKKAERLAKREEKRAAALERKAAREEASASKKRASSSDDDAEPTPSRAKPASKPSTSSNDGDDPLQGLDGL